MLQLISYIAPAAPATRRPATGREPYIRPEFGLTPNWYCRNLNISFGRNWHENVTYRYENMVRMARELKKRFDAIPIGHIKDPDNPTDLLTGIYGVCVIPAIYGIDVHYFDENWPSAAVTTLSDAQADELARVNLDRNNFFLGLIEQTNVIAELCGRIEGYLNWQGVLNNAYRLRGADIFTDMVADPHRAHHIFKCVTETMIAGITKMHQLQRRSGFNIEFCTVSNCCVNMIAPQQYEQFLLPCDRRLAEAFGSIGIHNCAWKADPYLNHYASMPNVSYIDMGIESDLPRAKQLFPQARRALMYTPTDLAQNSQSTLQKDLERIARQYGPCDVVIADIEADVPDEKVRAAWDICRQLSYQYST